MLAVAGVDAGTGNGGGGGEVEKRVELEEDEMSGLLLWLLRVVH